jgi:hypothetical protein
MDWDCPMFQESWIFSYQHENNCSFPKAEDAFHQLKALQDAQNVDSTMAAGGGKDPVHEVGRCRGGTRQP